MINSPKNKESVQLKESINLYLLKYVTFSPKVWISLITKLILFYVGYMVYPIFIYTFWETVSNLLLDLFFCNYKRNNRLCKSCAYSNNGVRWSTWFCFLHASKQGAWLAQSICPTYGTDKSVLHKSTYQPSGTVPPASALVPSHRAKSLWTPLHTETKQWKPKPVKLTARNQPWYPIMNWMR